MDEDASIDERLSLLRDLRKSQERLDEWLLFEERSGWTLKEFCRDRCPIKEISQLIKNQEILAIEMCKIRHTVGAIYDRDAWDLAKSIKRNIDYRNEERERLKRG